KTRTKPTSETYVAAVFFAMNIVLALKTYFFALWRCGLVSWGRLYKAIGAILRALWHSTGIPEAQSRVHGLPGSGASILNKRLFQETLNITFQIKNCQEKKISLINTHDYTKWKSIYEYLLDKIPVGCLFLIL
ncbi:MAG: hypothetical protein D6830_07885, partial [Ignavibacteria bacterium]